MTRTLTITVNEWESVRDGHLWIVRPGLCPHKVLPCGGADCCCAHEPPYDLLAAAAPCETCVNTRRWWDQNATPTGADAPCPDCRITLVGECPYCKGNPAKYRDVCGGVVVLGYAYPASEVLPVFDRYGVCDVGLPEEWMPHITIDADFGEVLACTRDPKYRNEWLEVSIDLAHYGDPAGLVGKWALQLAVQP